MQTTNIVPKKPPPRNGPPTKYVDPESYYIKIQIDFATAYGLNVAILTGKLYRLERELGGKIDDQGHKWIRMTTPEWAAELPFWSKRTIERAIADSEALNILLSRTFSGRPKWYRLNPGYVASRQNGGIGADVSRQSDGIETGYPVNLASRSRQNGELPRVLPRVLSPKKKKDDIFQKLLEAFQQQTSRMVFEQVFSPLQCIALEGDDQTGLALTLAGPPAILDIVKHRWLKRVQQTAARFGIREIVLQGVAG